ncbi:MAG TPA: LON peptidase substrate-binding domain-containing protein [Acidimicrobiales bacterium]|nr:LON peptidase substrate-binding domain-containing protein [Acidimicrobiales bacterium]
MAATRLLPMFPLSTVLFPHGELPLHVFEPRYRQMTDDCLAGDCEFGVVLISRGSEVGGHDQRFAVGTVAHIEAASRFDDGRWALLTEGRRRITVVRWLPDDPYPRAEVDDLPDQPVPVDETGGAETRWAETRLAEATSAVRRTRTLLSELGSPAPVVADLGGGGGDVEQRLWRLCAMAPLTAFDSQRILETDDPETRVALLTASCEALSGDLTALLGGDAGPGR